jgi:hypothetical protein
VAFKITNKLKVNNDNFKFNGDFKSHITVGRTPGEHLALPLFWGWGGGGGGGVGAPKMLHHK